MKPSPPAEKPSLFVVFDEGVSETGESIKDRKAVFVAK